MLRQWSNDAEPITCREDDEDRIYGARMGDKHSDSWRIMVGNLGTLPNERTGHGKIKIDKWKNLVTQNIDLNIISELNKDMGMLPQEDRIESIAKGWWDGLMCRSACSRHLWRSCIETSYGEGRNLE